MDHRRRGMVRRATGRGDGTDGPAKDAHKETLLWQLYRTTSAYCGFLLLSCHWCLRFDFVPRLLWTRTADEALYTSRRVGPPRMPLNVLCCCWYCSTMVLVHKQFTFADSAVCPPPLELLHFLFCFPLLLVCTYTSHPLFYSLENQSYAGISTACVRYRVYILKIHLHISLKIKYWKNAAAFTLYLYHSLCRYILCHCCQICPCCCHSALPL